MSLHAGLASLNPTLVYVLILAIFLGTGLALTCVIRSFTDYQTRKSHNDIGGFIFTTIGALYGVLLAFITVGVWEQYNTAAANVAREASAARALVRSLSKYPDQEKAGKVRQSLVAFIQATVGDEFPAMANLKESQTAEQALDNLWENARTLKEQDSYEQNLINEIMTEVNNLTQLRDERLGIVNNPKLVGVIRDVLLLGAFITLVFGVLFGAESFWWHITFVSMLAVLIASILFVVTELSHPFSSGIAIQPAGYAKVLKMMTLKPPLDKAIGS